MSSRATPLPTNNSLTYLPLHLVGLVTLAQAERRAEVARKELDLLDVGQQGLVDRLLVRCPGGGNLLLLYSRSY